MDEQNLRYVIAFDPLIYPPNKEDSSEIPSELRDVLENSGASIALYSGTRNFVSAYISRENVEEINQLEGILGVNIESRFDLD